MTNMLTHGIMFDHDLAPYRIAAATDTISANIDAFIGVEGLAIVELLDAYLKKPHQWMLDRSRANLPKETVIADAITALSYNRNSSHDINTRAQLADKILEANHQHFPFHANIARQKIADITEKTNLMAAL